MFGGEEKGVIWRQIVTNNRDQTEDIYPRQEAHVGGFSPDQATGVRAWGCVVFFGWGGPPVCSTKTDPARGKYRRPAKLGSLLWKRTRDINIYSSLTSLFKGGRLTV